MNIKSFISNSKDIILYLFFGVCTTLINVVAYWISAHILKLSTMASTIVAWILAVLFAYITNRKWVFHSSSERKLEILKEIISFISCRFGTGLVDWASMFVFVDILKFDDVIIKFMANIIVIILNYTASKLLIFKKRKDTINHLYK